MSRAEALTDGGLNGFQRPLTQGPSHLGPRIGVDVAGKVPVLLHALDVDGQLGGAGVAAQLLLHLVNGHAEAVQSLRVVQQVQARLGLPLGCQG